MDTGTLFNIQRYSLHDGPGIRTTFFLKGCPLKCRWCHNPEGISFDRELLLDHRDCIGCGSCVAACSHRAILLNPFIVRIDRNRCSLCLKCTETCPTGAIGSAGIKMNVSQVLQEALKDKVFYRQSGGGVTFSGGEPLAQPLFLLKLLKALKCAGIHTVVDTSGYAAWRNLEKVSELTDMFLYDLKLMSSHLSKKLTGKSNKLILENLSKLARIHGNIEVRIPLIPGINDNQSNLDAIAVYIKKLDLTRVSLHPYHRTALAKYEKLGLDYKLKNLKPPDLEVISAVRTYLENRGLKIVQ